MLLTVIVCLALSTSGIAFEGDDVCNNCIKIIKQTGKVAALEKLVNGKLSLSVTAFGLF